MVVNPLDQFTAADLTVAGWADENLIPRRVLL